MENPIWKAYQKFDDVVMHGVNKGVKAWNWTTGKTKTDLANSLLTVAPVFEGGGFMIFNPIYGIIASTAFLCTSHFTQIENKKQELLEKSASKKGLLLNPNDINLIKNSQYGPWFGILSGMYLSNGGFDHLATGAGHALRSSSHYVMRADYLPPGKNVVDRVKDKLADLVDDIQTGELAPATFQNINY